MLAASIAWDSQRARAITADDDLQFTVTQSPASPAIVQVGSTVTFTVNATVTVVGGYPNLWFEFDYPAGLTYVSGASVPAGLTCADNTPSAGIARCSYGSVIPGALVQFALAFTVGSNVTTAATQVTMRAGFSDGSPDNATAGTGDGFTGAGSIQTFSSGDFGIANGGPYATVFEGGATAYTTTITNNSGVSTGAFNASLSFLNATVTSATCLTSAVANGTGGGGGSSTATCTGSTLANGEALVFQAQVVANNTASGADIAPTLASSGLGINAAGTTIQVDEVGLDAGASLVTGSPVTVCTAAAGSDVANDTAAGAAQPASGALMIGSPSLNLLLQTADFTVSGPAVGALSAAAGCGANQSGVSFAPSAAGTYVVTANYNVGGSNSLSLAVTAAGGTATKLAFSQQPASGSATSAFATQPVVAIQDALSATVTTDNSTVVTLSLISGPGTLTCTGGLSKTAVAGVATFAGCSVNIAGTYQIRATSSPVLRQADGGSFAVSAAPSATKLGFLAQPASAVATAAFSTQPVVAVQDSGGATFTSDNTTIVTLSLAGGPGSLSCTGGLSKIVSSGVASFSGCAVSANGAGYILRATSTPILTQADGNSFTAASFGAASRLGYLVQPAGGASGVPFTAQPQVAVQDASGITVASDNTTSIALSVVSGPGTLTCSGGPSKTASGGVATFTGCYVSVSGSYVIRATSSPAYTQADTASISVAAGATKLGFTTQPSNASVGVAFPTQPVVAVQDAGGVTVTTDNTTVVSLALTGPGVLTCTGGLSKTVTAGVATFAGCAVSAAGTGDKLAATSSPVLTSAQSGTFNVTTLAPISSAQLVVAAPAAGIKVPRSRLSFSATTGSLASPTSVTLLIKRKSDNKYWNDASGEWEAAAVENAATNAASTWTFAVTGEDRREFAGTTVTVEARAVSGATTYTSAVTPEIEIR